jgi:hypothetical protein
VHCLSVPFSNHVIMCLSVPFSRSWRV